MQHYFLYDKLIREKLFCLYLSIKSKGVLDFFAQRASMRSRKEEFQTGHCTTELNALNYKRRCARLNHSSSLTRAAHSGLINTF